MYTEEQDVKMPLWAKAVVIIAVTISSAVSYLLVNGNRAVMIILGFAIAIVGGLLLKEKSHDNAT